MLYHVYATNQTTVPGEENNVLQIRTIKANCALEAAKKYLEFYDKELDLNSQGRLVVLEHEYTLIAKGYTKTYVYGLTPQVRWEIQSLKVD